MAEYFAPGYDRYFLSLRPPKGWPGWAAFDGNRMRELREAGVSDLSQYSGVVEDGVIYFAPKPAISGFVAKLDTLVHSFRINWPLTKQQLPWNLGIPSILCRSATAHRNSWGAVVNAEVVLEGVETAATASIIRKYRHRILNAAIKEARRSAPVLNWTSYLPIGYANISVFRQDYRRRRLSGFGLGEDLICTIRLQRIRRIKSPDIVGSTIETFGKWRIAWNKAWLEAVDSYAGRGL